MTRLRSATIQMARESRLASQQRPQLPAARADRERAMSMHTLIAAIDAAVGRDDSDDGLYYAATTFAVVWAAIGYLVWVSLVLAARIVMAIGHLVWWLLVGRKRVPAKKR